MNTEKHRIARVEQYRRRVALAESGQFELSDRDRDVIRFIAAGVYPSARELSKALGLASFEEAHISLHRLQAKGIVHSEPGLQGSTRLAPDIVVIRDEVFRLIPIGTS